MSLLQYQKQLRLVAARERMLVEGLDAASAAFEVGYESASQFNREDKRFFGRPPMRDIKVRRSPAPQWSVTNDHAELCPDGRQTLLYDYFRVAHDSTRTADGSSFLAAMPFLAACF
jgi:AraC-like DNA-binding protein